MAGLYGAMLVGATSVTGGTPLTVLSAVAPTNQRLRVTEYEISFDGTNSANTPATVTVSRSTGGTYTNTAVAPVKINDSTSVAETLQASFKTVCTVQPTIGDILRRFTVPVFGGTLILPNPPGQEDYVIGGTLLSLTVTAAQTVNFQGGLRYEE
jgi:hypothetical protein